MKKISYLMAAAALCAACGGNQGYTVTGTVENAADGDTVLLQKVDGRKLAALDTAVIKNGTFTFTGVQDTAVNRYITCKPKGADRGMMIDFFLENGKIDIKITAESGDAATGTPNNDAYQEVRNKSHALNAQMMDIYKTMADTTMSDEQRREKAAQMEELGKQMENVMIEAVKKNITNAVGVHMLKMTYNRLENEELESLLAQVPAAFSNDADINRIKKDVANKKKTAEGQKFVDFAMKTPEGKDVKLSDFVGKNKLVLVDFWASWCGPCRREMPNLVEAYKKYKSKGLEIVGVSLDQTKEAWVNGIKALKITWPQMSDLKYWECEGSRLYAVSGIPHVVLIDAEGTIVSRGLHGEELLKKIDELLK